MLFVYSLGHCQVGIVTNNPDKNAVLDLTGFNNKGLNLPQVALASTTSPSPLTAHVAGMMVYNTTTTAFGSEAVSPGVYQNNGTRWVPCSSYAGSYIIAPGSYFLLSPEKYYPGMTIGDVRTKELYLPPGVYRHTGNPNGSGNECHGVKVGPGLQYIREGIFVVSVGQLVKWNGSCGTYDDAVALIYECLMLF